MSLNHMAIFLLQHHFLDAPTKWLRGFLCSQVKLMAQEDDLHRLVPQPGCSPRFRSWNGILTRPSLVVTQYASCWTESKHDRIPRHFCIPTYGHSFLVLLVFFTISPIFFGSQLIAASSLSQDESSQPLKFYRWLKTLTMLSRLKNKYITRDSKKYAWIICRI